MEQMEKIRKLRESEKEILGEVYWIIFYVTIALVFLSIILIGTKANPIAAVVIAVILAIYTLALIYLIGLAVAFGTFRARRVLVKAEIDVKEAEKQQEEEGEIE
jgi:hypothetical protein